jgi:hypothetical protein
VDNDTLSTWILVRQLHRFEKFGDISSLRSSSSINRRPVVVVVKNGALTETHSDCCVTVHPANSVFFETKSEVHNAANQTSDVIEVYATFLSAAGAQPLIPATDPGGLPRQSQQVATANAQCATVD